jgi:glutamate-1-semialdehyde 2,1-aminomutase
VTQVAQTPHRERSAMLYARAQRRLPGGNTRSLIYAPPQPPYVERGHGYRVIDADGRRLIDLQNNLTALVHGHAHPLVTAAAHTAIDDGASFGLPSRHEIDLAELLAKRIPSAPLWRFANSGTEAVMASIRIARAVTGRDGVARFAGCYHGSCDAVAGPATGVPASAAGDTVVLPLWDADALAAELGRHGDRLACVLFDALPNRAGLRPASPDFVSMLRDETERRGILLIQDEVLTFRVAYGGAQSLYDVVPDLTTLGKIIGGGFPIGAVGGREDVMSAFDPRRPDAVVHGGTFTANPVSMRAGVAALHLLSSEEIARINALGDRLRAGLAQQGWAVTGYGSLVRVHADDPAALWWRLYERGLLMALNGLMAVSTPMDDGVIDVVLDVWSEMR